jgi:hypothetical protein
VTSHITGHLYYKNIIHYLNIIRCYLLLHKHYFALCIFTFIYFYVIFEMCFSLKLKMEIKTYYYLDRPVSVFN